MLSKDYLLDFRRFLIYEADFYPQESALDVQSTELLKIFLRKNQGNKEVYVAGVLADGFNNDEIRRAIEVAIENTTGQKELARGNSLVVCFVYSREISEEQRKYILSLKRNSFFAGSSLATLVVELSGTITVPKGQPIVPKEILSALTGALEGREIQETESDWVNYSQKRLPKRVETPWVTYTLMVLIGLAWIYLELMGGSTNTRVLVYSGAQVNSLIRAGEYWRLVSSMFLHIGFFHLAVNLFSLYRLGPITEMIYGHWRFTIIYFSAGIIGGLAGLYLVTGELISAGASGAIFGLLGALGAYGYNLPPTRRKEFWTPIVLIAGLNIFYGFVNVGINNYAHIGGMIGGALVALILAVPGRVIVKRSILLGTVLLILMLGMALLNSYLVQQDWEYHFSEGVIAYEKGDLHAAIVHFEKVVELEPDQAEAHYNLALTYYQLGETRSALVHVDWALQIRPNFAEAAMLKKAISGE